MAGCRVGFAFGFKAQVRGLRGGVDFPGRSLGLVACIAGLQLRLVGLLRSGATLPGDQCLGTDLRSLYAVVGIGRASRG